MQTTDSDGKYDYTKTGENINYTELANTINSMFKSIKKCMSKFGISVNKIFSNYPCRAKGQGAVYHSHTEYFKKDRESRNTYYRYLMQRRHTNYIRKTNSSTKQPVRRAEWRGKR